ncbi:cytochrome c peroxidase [Tautonia marina]|uniref:cytochrome c peroxidase n=1 Tax=Tautonia marina TaxID=2653855 RepID=UPI001260FDCE|nr:cytochrome c peroxidase [Tautonia marina]
MLRRARVALAVVALVASWIALTQAVKAQADQPPPNIIHLVGHEDLELLARVRDVIEDWDPRKLINPYVESVSVVEGGEPAIRKAIRRRDLLQFIADPAAAEALGKAFFWDMQAGSDFRRLQNGTFVGTSCASCHYSFGADDRQRFTQRIPLVVWDQYKADPSHPLAQQPYDVRARATQDLDLDGDPRAYEFISGSAGVEPRVFTRLNGSPAEGEGPWESECSVPREKEKNLLQPEHWEMFVEDLGEADATLFRQITTRNSPTVINSVFADRQFHDGRAESTFNGISIFGDRDRREVLHHRRPDGRLEPVRIAISNASLGSQAVGPIVNEVEMSYQGRTFHDLAKKLLGAPVLGYQQVNPNDSLLGPFLNEVEEGETLRYQDLIKRAFRREWWDDRDEAGNCQTVPLRLSQVGTNQKSPSGSLMEANFSLYWGLSLMLYQATLISNQTPFDAMMRGDRAEVEARWAAIKNEIGEIRLDRFPLDDEANRPLVKTGTEAFQYGFRVFLNRGCIECHDVPLFSTVYERDEVQDIEVPIVSRINRTLVPLALADALAFRLREAHDQALQNAANVLRNAKPELGARADRIVQELDLLRGDAEGSLHRLCMLIHPRLHPQGVPADKITRVAEILHTYEKTAYTRLGARPFFDEDQRIAFAEELTDPVLVEKMIIPDGQVDTRPRLPIGGLPASEHYSFYDLGFYNIGVAPPRYDPGIGHAEDTANIEALRRDRDSSIEEIIERNALSDRLSDQQLESLRGQLRSGILPNDEPLSLQQKRALQDEAVQLSDEINRRQRPSLGAPGSAYRFQSQWQRPQGNPAPNGPEQIQPEGLLPRELAPTPLQTAIDCPKDLEEPADVSWIRDYIPSNRRRSLMHFFSRARTLVYHEEPWGHREPFLHDNELAFWGAFKTPTLRNIELTAPYMHNGRILTLEDVIDFYDDGGHFGRSLRENPDKHPEMVDLDMDQYDQRALLFFLRCLTDDRVRNEEAPFDHPSLQIVNGYEEGDEGELLERVELIPLSGS